MNYKLELEINRQKKKLIEFQYKVIKAQIMSLQKLEQELIEEYGKLSDEGQKLAEENDALSLGHLPN